MGRIRGSTFYTRKVEDYDARNIEQENFEQNMENIGSVLKVGTALYKNPMLRDAVGGLEDLFQGSGEDTEALAKAAAAEELKAKKETEATDMFKAAESRRKGAMADFQSAPAGPPQGVTGMPELRATTPGIKQVAEEKARLQTAMADPMKEEAYKAAEAGRLDRMEDIQIDLGNFKNYIKDRSGGRSLKQIRLSNEESLEQYETLVELANLSTDPADKQTYMSQAQEAKDNADSEQELIDDIKLAGDQLAASGKARTGIQEQRRTAYKGMYEASDLAEASIDRLDRVIGAEKRKLNAETQQKIDQAIEGIMNGSIQDAEVEAQIAALGNKLDSMSDQDAMMLAGDPRGQIYYEVAKRRALAKTGEFATGGDLGSALAGLEEAGAEPFAQPPGPTGPGEEVATTVTEEVVETPAGMPSLISDEDLTGSTPAEKNKWIDKIQTRLLTRYGEGSPMVNDVMNEVRSRINSGRIDTSVLGNTPAEIERSLNSLIELKQQLVPQQQVPEGGMEVPNIAGSSLQEAQMIAMQIGQNPNISFKAKQEAMRALLKQVKFIEDVTSDFAATGGTVGYVGTSAAANSLMKAFSGSVPKAPKAASEYQRSEIARKKAEAPGKAESTRLKNLKLVNQITDQFTQGPIDADNKLLKNMISVLKLDQLRTKKGSTGGGGPSNDKLEEFREEIMAGSDGSFKWLRSQVAKIDYTVSKIGQLSVAELSPGGLDNQGIATKYGADLSRYLQDVRNAETAQAKAAALTQAKKDIVRDLAADKKKFKTARDKINPMLKQLRDLGISKENKAKREKLLRALNQLLQDIQGDI